MWIHRAAWPLLCVSVFASVCSTQVFTDLQSGRNFPTAALEFGGGRSENIDVGDCDNDGDYDVIVANGGDGSGQLNLIFINNGGSQGGTVGTFTDETAARFAGVPLDRSRDIEFADYDGDFDLDIYVANRGTTAEGGQVSRAYLNQGGEQLGAVGFYVENTDVFWGDLVAVPVGDQVFGNGQGPFRDYTCDCDFGDLDLDGDIDLFHSSYGPNINGAQDSRVFLNDGAGRFNELWPWANPGADIQMHVIDLDLVDLDSDYDLDVFASSRDSQARVFRNDLGAGGFPAAPFTDVTQTALFDTGAVAVGTNNYECEFGDLDGDGDFDIYAKDYEGFQDRILKNVGGLTFEKEDWLLGDPNQDESEVDLFDFDGDGDLDAFLANFSGTNWLYANGTAQGFLTPPVLQRTGNGLYPDLETPATSNGGTTLDADCADMDGDGDTDVLLANGGDQMNRYWENVLGIPDTHAPQIHLLTVQGDKSDGSDTPIRVQLRDNASYYIVNFYRVDLFYTLNGGVVNRLPMVAQGSMQFQASIPGELNGVISYLVQGSDDAGNGFTSAITTYTQTSSGSPALLSVDKGTPGVSGHPYLDAKGSLAVNSPMTLSLRDAAPDALAVLFLSNASSPVSFKGALFYPVPLVTTKTVPTTGPGGLVTLIFNWPPGVVPGTEIWCQYGVVDGAAIGGASLTNAVVVTAP